MYKSSTALRECQLPVRMAVLFFDGNLGVLLVYSVVMGSAFTRRVDKGDEGDTEKKITFARCTSRCLALHITQLSASFRSLQDDNILAWCGKKRRCSQCMQPCMGQWEEASQQCHKKCENHHECVTSCEFLKSLKMNKQGDCPPPHRASGFTAACVLSCSIDKDCPGIKKCCANGCGFTCQVPVNKNKGLPLKPNTGFIFNEHFNGSIGITWKSRFNVSAEPVLYILQRRWNYGIQPSEDRSTSWQTITVTATHRFSMTDIRPNRWYQFRVAAVNVHGTLGFTTPSKHFHSRKDPLPPTAPTGLRHGNLTTVHDGTLTVHITWAAPQEQDLKIHHYRISWRSKTNLHAGSKRDSWRLTDGANTEFSLENLLPNTEYLVKIQAVSFWGQKRLKSSKSQLIIRTTLKDPKLSNLHPIDGCKTIQTSCTLQASSIYHNNQVHIKVSWKPVSENHVEFKTYLIKWKPVLCENNENVPERKATVQGSNFVISGLLFACKYKVTVRPFTLQASSVEEMTFVKTPRCNNMKVKNLKDAQCPRQGRHRLSRNGIQKTEKLTAAFHKVNGKIQGEFQWQAFQKVPTQNLTGFLFSWAEISGATAVYSTQILPADFARVVIENLKPSTFYHIKLRAIYSNQEELSIEKTFKTPIFR
ncbi:anosmin-1-like [Aquarana catesbeiana]|uniref:anosmin-1-like n=1 Tax=Aquarana catesbeiana TaxID=8400 RepID=UPI003CC9632F